VTGPREKGDAVAVSGACIIDPLPQRYLTTEPGIGGVIKQRAQDFVVEELALYEPCGAGEHLYLRVQKTNVSHHELLSCVRRHFDVPAGAIGFAGMKDKVAVTAQTIGSRSCGPSGTATRSAWGTSPGTASRSGSAPWSPRGCRRCGAG
jgi:tRNA(Glu) U13 pseudouridine synthase TruD